MASKTVSFLLLAAVLLVLLPRPAAAFGAGNIASISKIEGQNFRHGDIEDYLKTLAFLHGKKWTSMLVKRVYFGNWLRDYSQAVDTGTLKGVQAETIRVLVWILSFISFGYATAEFEVTADRLGVYKPEEHIDNPKDYADNIDARQFDSRLRGPVMPEELAVDPNTGMKNYIANEYGGWATSTGYIKYSLQRSIHYGRVYTSGAQRGRDEDLCEALRCLGQALHCLEDFGAHTNYTELALRELGYHNVFPHVGVQTQINLHGKHVFPLVTGTFGGVDFLHSVLGEANDHFTQAGVQPSEVDNLGNLLGTAQASTKRDAPGGGSGADGLVDLLSKVPGTSHLAQEARDLQAMSDAQEATNYGSASRAGPDPSDPYATQKADYQQHQQQWQQHQAQQPPTFSAPPGSQGGPPAPGLPGVDPKLDPATIIPKIYPILAFRDKVVRSISAVVSKIPGLESLIENITERLTIFVFSLLAPFVRPIIAAASNSLKAGSSAVVESSAKHQFEPWTDPTSTNPTHSMLSKDHFSNILNEPAGKIAAAILQYVAPRVLYAWENPGIPVEQVLNDVQRVFHHPAIRDRNNEAHRKMFEVVEHWARNRKPGSPDLNTILSSESVRAGKNHIGADFKESLEPGIALFNQQTQHAHGGGGGGHGGAHGSTPLSFLSSLTGTGSGGSHGGGGLLSSLTSGNSPFNFTSTKRDIDDFAEGPTGGAAYGGQQGASSGYDDAATASFGGAPQFLGGGQGQTYQGHTPQPPEQQQYGQYQQPVGGYGQPQEGYSTDYRQHEQQPEQQQGYGNWNAGSQGPYGQSGGYGGGY